MVTAAERLLSAVLRAVCVILFLAGPAGVAYGQTDYSLRMRALGTDLSGIVDDPISDAFRNPARVGGMSGTQVYAGQLPGRAFSFVFPELRSYWYAPIPEERIELYDYSWNYVRSQSYTPLSFSVLTRLPGSMPFSATVEVAASGRNRMEETVYLSPDGVPIFEDLEEIGYGPSNRNDFYHVLVDLALSGSPPQDNSRSTGLRVTVSYDNYEWADAWSTYEIETDVEDLTELVSDLDSRLQEKKYDETDASLNFGLFRPGSTLRELLTGVGVTRRTGTQHYGRTEIFDQDYDGNGEDPYGFRPVYTYDRSLFESNRDYRALRVSGAAVFDLGAGVRTKHSITWSEGRGDGAAAYRVDDEFYDGIISQVYNEVVDYTYDGDTRQYMLSSTIGLAGEVYNGLTAAVGSRIFYVSSAFEEDADGSAGIRFVRFDTSLSVETPFQQRVRYGGEGLQLHVPASLEWEIHSYLTFRLGLLFTASRLDYDASGRQSADLLGVQLPFDDLSRNEENHVIYSTSVSSVVGFALNLKEKILVDFLDTNAGEVGFSYVSVRYKF
jgi:hypothetical protein